MITQTCESCGREFGCGAQDDSCWCAAQALGPDRLAILREHFERCLCPDCLTVAAGERQDDRLRSDGAPEFRDPVEDRPYWRSGR